MTIQVHRGDESKDAGTQLLVVSARTFREGNNIGVRLVASHGHEGVDGDSLFDRDLYQRQPHEGGSRRLELVERRQPYPGEEEGAERHSPGCPCTAACPHK